MPDGWHNSMCLKCNKTAEHPCGMLYCPLSHAVEVKPTANADLVGALEKLADKYGKVCSITGSCCDSARQDVAGEIYSILSKYRPVPPLPVEPSLEELSKRKGCEVLQFGRLWQNLYMQAVRLPDGNDRAIEGCSPTCTKAKARAYLEALPDKGEIK